MRGVQHDGPVRPHRLGEFEPERVVRGGEDRLGEVADVPAGVEGDLDVTGRPRRLRVGGGDPVRQVARRIPRIDPVHVVAVGVAGVPAGHRLEGADVHQRHRDHSAGESAGVEFVDELGDRKRPLLLVAVDAAVDQQHRPGPGAVRDEHGEPEGRPVHAFDGRYEAGSAAARSAAHGADGEFPGSSCWVAHCGEAAWAA